MNDQKCLAGVAEELQEFNNTKLASKFRGAIAMPMPQPSINVYFAGHTQDVAVLREIIASMERASGAPAIRSCSRWLSLVGKIGGTPALAREFWDMDFADIDRADAVVVSTTQTKRPLRGALVEAGYAIARSIPVVVVGDNDGFGTWQYHRSVVRVDSVEEALLWLRLHFGQIDGVISLRD